MLRRTSLASLGAFAVIAALGACATAPAPAPLGDTLGRDARLGTFNRLAAQAGLTDQLRATGPYTVFVPTDEAFKALPAKTMDALNADPALLKAVLSHHVVEGRTLAADVRIGPVKTLQGATINLAKAGEVVTVDDAIALQVDLVATNGVAHVIDRVLVPPKK